MFFTNKCEYNQQNINSEIKMALQSINLCFTGFSLQSKTQSLYSVKFTYKRPIIHETNTYYYKKALIVSIHSPF